MAAVPTKYWYTNKFHWYTNTFIGIPVSFIGRPILLLVYQKQECFTLMVHHSKRLHYNNLDLKGAFIIFILQTIFYRVLRDMDSDAYVSIAQREVVMPIPITVDLVN